jgi:hypothetical protein
MDIKKGTGYFLYSLTNQNLKFQDVAAIDENIEKIYLSIPGLSDCSNTGLTAWPETAEKGNSTSNY